MTHKSLDFIAILGPTSCGKSALVLELARLYPNAFEFISVDSVQIYKGMDIGSAKPSYTEQRLVKHHLIDICDPIEIYSAASFVEQASSLIHDIRARGKIAVLAGGTMLYFKAFKHGLCDVLPATPDVKKQASLLMQDTDKRWDFLQNIDPLMASKLHPADTQRIQRAIEVFLSTKVNLTTWQSNTKRSHDFNGEYVLLHPAERDIMHKRIESRFDSMLSDGLVQEVEYLLKKSFVTLDLSYPSMRAIGYKQVWEYLHNIIDKETMRESAIVATRRYFKRQCTWLKHWEHPYRSFADVDSAKAYITLILQR